MCIEASVISKVKTFYFTLLIYWNYSKSAENSSFRQKKNRTKVKLFIFQRTLQTCTRGTLMYSLVYNSRAPCPSQGGITAWLLLTTVRLGKLNKKLANYTSSSQYRKMTPHECHMLKINVQLCILLLLHLFSSVHIGPYNCFFSSMNKSKLNLKMNFIWWKRRINFDSVYRIVYAQIVRSSSDSLSL